MEAGLVIINKKNCQPVGIELCFGYWGWWPIQVVIKSFCTFVHTGLILVPQFTKCIPWGHQTKPSNKEGGRSGYSAMHFVTECDLHAMLPYLHVKPQMVPNGSSWLDIMTHKRTHSPAFLVTHDGWVVDWFPVPTPQPPEAFSRPVPYILRVLHNQTYCCVYIYIYIYSEKADVCTSEHLPVYSMIKNVASAGWT